MKKFASILLSMLMATGAIAAASAETYTGTAQGIGEVSVTLTVEDGKITAAEVVGENETKGIGYEPCADGTYADAIVAAQGVDFDSISGATVTSNAVKDATKKAMAAAGLIEAEDTTVADAEWRGRRGHDRCASGRRFRREQCHHRGKGRLHRRQHQPRDRRHERREDRLSG